MNFPDEYRDDLELTAVQLDDKYNREGDGEHPLITRQNWREEVANQGTVSGYWEWLVHRLGLIKDGNDEDYVLPDEGGDHDLYETGDPGAPDIIKDRNGEVVLGLCKRCGRGEVELSEPCMPPLSQHERERQGLAKLIDALIAKGWTPYTVYDGEATELVKGKTISETVEVCDATEDAHLYFVNDALRRGHLYLVWGNSPSELVCDHTLNHGFGEAVDTALREVFPGWPNCED